MSDGRVTWQVLTDLDEWDRLAPEWEALFSQADAPSMCLHWHWLRTWWEVYGSTYAAGASALRIISIRRDARLIGVVPLYLRARTWSTLGTRRLMFISTGEAEFEETCPDYLDLLHAPGDDVHCLPAIRQAMTAVGSRHVVEMQSVPAASSLRYLCADTSGTTMLQPGTCPIADLSDGFDSYVSRLAPRMRTTMRRLIRLAGDQGLTLTIAATPGQGEAFLDDLIALHQARWQRVGQPGCFAAARFTAFHRALVRLWAPQGRAILARVGNADSPLTVLYGFLNGRTFHFYQSGTAAASQSVPSPGITAHAMLMSALAARGVKTYDFLRGTAEYKLRLATGARPVVDFTLVRRGMPTLAHEATVLAHRAVRGSRTAAAQFRHRTGAATLAQAG